jgi:pimeloyl-ACP methyl ester carboxylesterase
MATRTISVLDAGKVPVSYHDRGADDRTYLLLHGGAGPQSVAGFGDRLAQSGAGRVITPAHPGFDDTPRPDGLSTIAGLARLYLALLDDLGLTDVMVIGNSIGGWIAAEMAVAGSARITAVTLVSLMPSTVVPSRPRSLGPDSSSCRTPATCHSSSLPTCCWPPCASSPCPDRASGPGRE